MALLRGSSFCSFGVKNIHAVCILCLYANVIRGAQSSAVMRRTFDQYTSRVVWRCCLAVRRPWGEPTEEVTALRRFAGTTPPTDRLFTGQRRYGPKSGIYYYGSRFYSTDVGRFLQPDTIVPGAGNPQALNRYSYTLNNPVKYTDPTGHHPYGACDSRGH